MKRRPALGWVSGGAAVAALAAAALNPLPLLALPGTSISGSQDVARPDPHALATDHLIESRRVLQVYGRCVARRFWQLSRHFVALVPGTAESNAAGARLSSPDCLAEGELAMNGLLLWGAVSAALYEREYAGRPVTDLSAIRIDTDAPPGPGSVAPGWETEFALHRYANCVTRLNPRAVRALILGAVGGSEEDAAIEGLRPDLGTCLASGEVRFNRDTLRAHLAGSLYRLTRGAAATGNPPHQ